MARRNLFTVRDFVSRNQGFTEKWVWWLRHRSRAIKRTSKGNGPDRIVKELPPNGFAEAFVKVGGKLFIDEDRFFEIIDEQNQHE